MVVVHSFMEGLGRVGKQGQETVGRAKELGADMDCVIYCVPGNEMDMSHIVL